MSATDAASLIVSYDLRLVALSVVFACTASYAALDLLDRVTAAHGKARLVWLITAAIAMGNGIWSTHYVGMESLRLPVATAYHWPTVLVSVCAAIVFSGMSIYLIAGKGAGAYSVLFAGIILAGGMAAAHYMGMDALRIPARSHYSYPLLAWSVVLAIVFTWVTFYLTLKLRESGATAMRRKLLCATTFASAILVMQYVGMASVVFTPSALSAESARQAVSISALDIVAITVVAFVLMALWLLLSHADRRYWNERQLVETFLENVPEAVYFKDRNSRFLRVSRAMARRFQFNEPSLAVGKTDSDLFSSEHAEDALKDEQEIIRTGQPLLGKEEEETWEDGRRAWVLTNKMPFRDHLGEIVGTMGISHDITALKLATQEVKRKAQEIEEANRELKALAQAAEAGNRTKGEFLANMSHEIRTPLNGVIGMTELALQTELSREQREYLETVRWSAESLLSIINDILDYSKIEAGKVELEAIDFDLRECLENTLKTLALRSDEKDIELLCEVEPKVPQFLIGDPNRLRQIIVNLVGNALKFTHEGEVILQVSASSLENGLHALEFVVSDTGVGISPDKLERVFESFTQADTSTTREYGGTGLGLTISKRLVEMMGGKIWVESEVGRGSAFHFTAAFAVGKGVGTRPGGGQSQPMKLDGVRVLIVDDNRTNRRILQGQLSNWGMKTTVASDGGKALACIEAQRSAGEPFDLILTDMHMPRMDGFKLLEHIKEEDSGGMAAIMMLTSGGRRTDAARCNELGVGAYLTKPVRQVELREAIAKVLSRHEQAVIEPVAEKVPSTCIMQILLAEDNLVNRKLAMSLLEKRGHRVDVATNGREALLALGKSSYDLVLMDVQMPEMDGIEATAAFRNAERDKGTHVPIVAMTALVMKGDRERCLDAGMDGYISKPIRVPELDEVLQRYMTQKVTGDLLLKEFHEERPTDGFSTIDSEDLLCRIGNDREFLVELVNMFCEESPEQIRTIKAALQKGDLATVNRCAHSLRGALANLSAKAAATLAADIEAAARMGDLNGANLLVSDLEGEVSRAIEALNAICAERVP